MWQFMLNMYYLFYALNVCVLSSFFGPLSSDFRHLVNCVSTKIMVVPLNLILLLTILVSFLLTYLIRLLAVRHRVLDIPNERSSHTIPTPRGGGLAIVIVWFTGLCVLFVNDQIEKDLFLALLSGLLLAVIGFLDDIFSIRPIMRLLFQMVSASLALYFLGNLQIDGLMEISPILSYLVFPLWVIAIVWFINLFNFLDGIDGYASLEAIFIALAMYLFTGATIHLILVAAVFGFLIWNWPKAKIFMGDVGSTQLGFVLIVLGIYFHNHLGLSILLWIMLSALFWFDASITLFRRWKRKEKLSEAHRKHVYQRAVQSGMSHLKTDMYSMGINGGILVLAYCAYLAPFFAPILLTLEILLLYSIVRQIDQKVPFQ